MSLKGFLIVVVNRTWSLDCFGVSACSRHFCWINSRRFWIISLLPLTSRPLCSDNARHSSILSRLSSILIMVLFCFLPKDSPSILYRNLQKLYRFPIFSANPIPPEKRMQEYYIKIINARQLKLLGISSVNPDARSRQKDSLQPALQPVESSAHSEDSMRQ